MVALGALMAQAASQNGVVPMNFNRDAVLKFFAENVYGVRPKFEGFVPKAEIVKEERIADRCGAQDGRLEGIPRLRRKARMDGEANPLI